MEKHEAESEGAGQVRDTCGLGRVLEVCFWILNIFKRKDQLSLLINEERDKPRTPRYWRTELSFFKLVKAVRGWTQEIGIWPS